MATDHLGLTLNIAGLTVNIAGTSTRVCSVVEHDG
jgi:hypothetical protein